MGLEINNVIVSGNLTRDVELKDTPIGRKVCTFTVANNRTYVSQGNKVQETSFLDTEVWGVIAENCAKYLQKGSPVVVIGRLKQERWEDQNGGKRSRIKIVASNVQFMRSPGSGKRPNDDSQFQAAAAGSGDETSGWE